MDSETSLDPDDLLHSGEAARILQVSVETLRRWSNNGALPVILTPGGQRRFRRSDVNALLCPKKAS